MDNYPLKEFHLKQNDAINTEAIKRYRDLFEHMSIGITICRPDGKFIDVNQAYCKITGYTQEELKTMSFQQITYPNDLMTDLYYLQLLNEGKINNYSIEKRYIRKNHQIIWVKLFISSIPDENNLPISFIASVENITGHKQAEEELRKREAQLRAIFESSQDAIGISKHGIHITANPSYIKLFGFKNQEEIVGKSLLESIAPSHRPDILHKIEARSLKETVSSFYESRCIRTDGAEFDAEFSVSTYELEGEVYSLASIRDITERNRVNAQLKESEQKYRTYVDQSPEAIFIVDGTGKYIDVNTTACFMLGYTREELLQLSIAELSFEEHPEEGSSTFQQLKKTGSLKFETLIRHKDGEFIPIELNAVQLSTDKYMAFCTDITERKMIENRLIQSKDKAEENDRLKTSFLQNMSHEIRTPMNAIVGFASLLPTSFSNKEKLNKYATIIQQRGADLLEIINDILDIAKIESGQLSVQLQACDLNELFSEIKDFFVAYRKRLDKVDIKFYLKPQCLKFEEPIITDKIKLKQILFNLISNAFKFTKAGKVVVGRIMEDTDNLSFYVSDTGIGIPKDKQAEIFDRFVQLDGLINKFRGTGLGLPIVKGLVNLLGGQISLESGPGMGSTFFVTIPYTKANSYQKDKGNSKISES